MEKTPEQKAWELYCEETKGGLDVKDFWEDLSETVQKIYLEKISQMPG